MSESRTLKFPTSHLNVFRDRKRSVKARELVKTGSVCCSASRVDGRCKFVKLICGIRVHISELT